ncbi:MAG: hypothetical protein AB8G15_10200 [Saprospiraceae bacterium]
MKKILFCLFYLLSGVQAFAQEPPNATLPPNANSFNYGHCLEEVHFGGTYGTNYLEIRKDDNSGDYQSPQFKKNYPINCLASDGTITRQSPVAYVSGTKASVKAIFQSDCESSYYIRGLGPNVNGNQVIFSKQEVTPESGYVVYEFTEANISFKDGEVYYWEDFTISWEISETGEDDSWIYIDESKNPLYVTRSQPEMPSGQLGYAWFHTLFKVSCKNATTLSDQNEIIDAIWNKLKTKSVIAADNNQPLKYYSDWLGCGNSFTTESLLALNDGQCGSWARFFIDLLKIQNITHASVEDDFYHFSSDLGPGSGFFVKDWTATTGVLSNGNPTFKYTIIPKQSPSQNWFLDDFMANNKYNFHYSDLEDNFNTIGGQGPTNNPQSIFSNHQITQINDALKDPSYGTDFLSLDDIENKALFGYFIIVESNFDETNLLYDFDGDGQGDDLNGNGIIESSAAVQLILVTTDKSVSSLIRTPNSPTNH